MVNALFAFVTALAVAFGATPVVRILAKNVGAIDVPKDNRRMHKTPIPRMGGLAIFFGFVVAVLLFSRMTIQMKSILLGAVVLVVLGVVDDIKPLPALFKLVVQIGAALIPVSQGVKVYSVAHPFISYDYIRLGIWSVPLTVIWIVGMINAVNFIDGLDGLAVGISSIASVSMLVVAALVSEGYVVIIMAALAGACIGFMPFNINPAKIFMGDTGSMFLGYILAVMSVQGLFKFYAIVTFAVPFVVLGLPIIDTVFAIVRRLLKGQSPFTADRGHVHHRLVDLGFDQKQTVAILYALSAVLGLSAVVLTSSGEAKILILVLAVALAVFFGISVFAYDVKKEKQQKEQEKKDEDNKEN
ncbi:MAG: undecaprenyl/decaprenyl-phosphate alpha-N-acetylglucosaminyl 1-phosphate transferase [Ruminococcaceae bacterium]|nr:undecaprenyl/decaprenyl-phosphate alpha-N-acetylglucosaminyl 1-phosphate transferase [Oscillospiraceae bacterium]